MIEKLLIAIVLLLTYLMSYSCKRPALKNNESPIPDSFQVIMETEGDLDEDGIIEKICVYNTGKVSDFGIEREIYMYKKDKSNWKLWKKAKGAVLSSDHGGSMGDPFQSISIVNNCIEISHFGGTREKWNYLHKFQYINEDFALIETTINFGSPCDYFFQFNYQLIDGEILYKKEVENCETESLTVYEESMIKKVINLPTMDGFYPGENELKLQQSKTTIYY